MKRKIVVKLATEGKTIREIAEQVHISFRAIGEIINRVTGDDVAIEEEEERKAP